MLYATRSHSSWTTATSASCNWEASPRSGVFCNVLCAVTVPNFLSLRLADTFFFACAFAPMGFINASSPHQTSCGKCRERHNQFAAFASVLFHRFTQPLFQQVQPPTCQPAGRSITIRRTDFWSIEQLSGLSFRLRNVDVPVRLGRSESILTTRNIITFPPRTNGVGKIVFC